MIAIFIYRTSSLTVLLCPILKFMKASDSGLMNPSKNLLVSGYVPIEALEELPDAKSRANGKW